MSKVQHPRNRTLLGFAIAPLIPILIYAIGSGDFSLVVLAVGAPAAYVGALLVGAPLFFVLRHLKFMGWSYFVLGGALAALPFVYLYSSGATTHLEIYGVRNTAFFCAIGAFGGLVFWLIAVRGQSQYSISLIKAVIGSIVVLSMVPMGVYIGIVGGTNSTEGTMTEQTAEFISSLRREVSIELDEGSKVSAYLPAKLPFRPGCPIYITSRKEYFGRNEIYWVNGYKDSAYVNVWEIITEEDRGKIPRQCL